MPTLAQNQYLTTEVMTATPQRLHLLLIEGVIRLAERARQCWRDGDHEKAGQALVQAQRIVMEMIGGIKQERSLPVATQVAAVYWFVYRSLVDANIQREEKRLDDALKVLRVEQGTWRLVCEQLGSSEVADQAASVDLSERISDHPEHTVPPPAAWARDGIPRRDVSEVPAGGFSFEA